jgi:hypothetical protein
MQLRVTSFSEYRTLLRDDLLEPRELDEFAVSPGLSTCTGHGTTSTSCICCCAAAPSPLAA